MAADEEKTPKKHTFRVYFVSHLKERRSGILIERFDDELFPPEAYGRDEAEVLTQLEQILRDRLTANKDRLERYLWASRFQTRRVTVSIHPRTLVDKRPVIGAKRIPLQLTYAWTPLGKQGFRVFLPRFYWWMNLEQLDDAAEVLQSAVASALLGTKPRSIYDFRREGEEYVRDWEPQLLKEHRGGAGEESEDEDEFVAVREVADEWVEQAKRKRLPPVVGDDSVLTPHLALVRRDPPPSILLVGEPGVGKTAWVRRLARTFARWQRKEKRETARIWHTSGERIIAGMVYLGMWQARCLKMVEELRGEGDFLYVDRLSSILRPMSDGSSIADILAPALEDEEISILSECSEAELERLRRRFPSFVDRFEIIRVAPTPAREMPALMELYLQKKRWPLSIHPVAGNRLLQYLSAFERARHLPGKAFAFLDWLGQKQSPVKGGSSEPKPSPRRLLPVDAAAAYSDYSGLPVALISDDHSLGAAVIEARLTARVVGQPDACLKSAKVLARFKARLNDPERPLGSLLFVGPTGVGKTELAKQLTRFLFGDAERMIRLDMSEYQAPGSAARLLRARGDEGGLATRLRRQPLSLVLLDEIEKAHPDVFDLLLGLLGEGRISDALGQTVDCRMALFVMTSNLGAGERPAAGFGGDRTPDYTEHVRRHFRPEFMGRLDNVIAFRHLDSSDIERIVDLELAQAAKRRGLKRRGLSLRVSPEARHLLAKRGFHPTYGARPLRRTIEALVITPLAMRMAEDPSLTDRIIPVEQAGSKALEGLSAADRAVAIALADGGA